MATAAKPKTTRKRRRTTKRRAAPRKPRAAMPDIGRPQEPGAITGEAYSTGRYELEPQIRPQEPQESPTAAADGSPGPLPPQADGAPSHAPGGVDANGFPLPPSAVRMVHTDPTAVADGMPVDETGAILVPLARIDEFRGLGYRVEHLHERAA